jgi:signal transduction histidine kinase
MRPRFAQIWKWFTTQTYVPGWLPSILRHRWTSYGVAALAQIVAAVITFQFVSFFPTFAVRGALLLLVLAFVALEFGAGPSLVATCLGALLFDFLLLPPYVSFSVVKGASLAGVAIFLIAGFILVHLASQRERSRRAARTAMEVMEEFMGTASHELRAPLAGALMSMELAHRQLAIAQDRTGDDPVRVGAIAESLELLANTREQLRRQQRLVADLLDVARIQSSGLALNLQSTDVIALVVEIVQEMHRIEKSRAITVELPETPVEGIMADPDRFRQALGNFLSNAFRYSPPSRPIHVRVRTMDSSLVVEVHDEGPGVPIDQQQRIWERYQRVSETPVQAGANGGLGLGLYISRNIIEGHGGSVGLESAPGQGAVFWFTLPIAPSYNTLASDTAKGTQSE